jgi:ribonuclease P protein component
MAFGCGCGRAQVARFLRPVATRAVPSFQPELPQMLPAVHRMQRSGDFLKTVRQGSRAGGPLLVAHMWQQGATDSAAELPPARVGLIVSRGVGGAVTRTRVKRRLRAQVAAHLSYLPAGSLWVFRAQNSCAAASSDQLGRSVQGLIERGLRRRGGR